MWLLLLTNKEIKMSDTTTKSPLCVVFNKFLLLLKKFLLFPKIARMRVKEQAQLINKVTLILDRVNSPDLYYLSRGLSRNQPKGGCNSPQLYTFDTFCYPFFSVYAHKESRNAFNALHLFAVFAVYFILTDLRQIGLKT